MKRILLDALVIASVLPLCLVADEPKPTPAETTDGKAITMRVDRFKNEVSVSHDQSGITLTVQDNHLGTSEEFLTSATVKLNCRQAKRLAELLNEAADDRANVAGEHRHGVESKTRGFLTSDRKNHEKTRGDHGAVLERLHGESTHGHGEKDHGVAADDKRRREYYWRDETPNGTGKPLWFGDVYGRGFSGR